MDAKCKKESLYLVAKNGQKEGDAMDEVVMIACVAKFSEGHSSKTNSVKGSAYNCKIEDKKIML